MADCTLDGNGLGRVKRAFGCHERRTDVRGETGEQRFEQIVGQRIGILARREPLGETDGRGAQHSDPEDVQRRRRVQRRGERPPLMQALMSFSARAVVSWKNSNRWKSWLRLGTDRSMNISSKYSGLVFENS